jgi:hypothetical protein
MSEHKVKEDLEDFLKEGMSSDKKKESLEEIFQKTLDLTTPSQPGDVRSERVFEKKQPDEWF